MRHSELPLPSPLAPWHLLFFWWDWANQMSQAFWSAQQMTGPCMDSLGRATLSTLLTPMSPWSVSAPARGRLLPFPKLAGDQAVPPAPPYVPEPASPPMPHPTPDPVPPEIDDPPPVEVPAPMHEPPVMPTPMAANVVWLSDAGDSEDSPSGQSSNEAA